MCVCIRALVFWHEECMRRVKLSPLTCRYLPYFLHYLINGKIFRKIVIEREMHVLILSSTFV